MSITDVLYPHPRERHITDVEDNTVLEVSLGEPGASARAKAVRQVNSLSLGQSEMPHLLERRTVTD